MYLILSSTARVALPLTFVVRITMQSIFVTSLKDNDSEMKSVL